MTIALEIHLYQDISEQNSQKSEKSKKSQNFKKIFFRQKTPSPKFACRLIYVWSFFKQKISPVVRVPDSFAQNQNFQNFPKKYFFWKNWFLGVQKCWSNLPLSNDIQKVLVISNQRGDISQRRNLLFEKVEKLDFS